MSPDRDIQFLTRKVLSWVQYGIGLSHIRVLEGTEHLPASGPAVICANHASYYDPAILSCGTFGMKSHRLIRFMAIDKYFEGHTGWYVRLYRCIPVSLSGVSARSFRLALTCLYEGKLLGIFPEGGRTLDGRLQPFMPGAAKIATQAGVPIIPVTINGTYDIWPPHGWFPRPFVPVELHYHPPIPTDRKRRGDSSYIQDLTQRIYESVASRYKPPTRKIPCTPSMTA